MYAGITIGPVIESMQNAKKTRELWFASYWFSWYMEEFVRRLSHAGYVLIAPTEHLENKSIVGKYHDRVIFYSSTDTATKAYEDLVSFNTEIRKYFVDLIYETVERIAGSKETIEEVIKDYFQVKWFCSDNALSFQQISDILNQAEQNRNFLNNTAEKPCDRCRYHSHFIQIEDKKENRLGKKIHLCPICYLKYHAIEITNRAGKLADQQKYYPSTIMIASSEIRSELEAYGETTHIAINDDDKVVSEYIDKKYKDKPYLKYFAIIAIDGDNIGNILNEKMSNIPNTNPEDTKSFSTRLHDLADEFVKIVDQQYRGRTVYAAGDDLLALVPIYNDHAEDMKHVLDVVHQLNEKVRSTFDGAITSSCGISIQHYTYPLKYALESAIHLLGEAKANGRDQISISVRKHAGAAFKLQIAFDKPTKNYYTELCEFLTQAMKGDKLPKSLYLKLREFHEILCIAKTDHEIDNFIDNHFNEEFHRSHPEGWNDLKGLLHRKGEEDEGERSSRILSIANILRLARLFYTDKHGKTSAGVGHEL